MFSQFQKRSYELEHLDKGDYTPDEYEGCMVELRRVNRFLGDASALRHSLLAEIEREGLNSFSVLDVGAGSGELLRVAAGWAQETERKTLLVGLELNARSAKATLEESRGFASINSVRGDALRLPFADDCFDYAICSLFTHHFKDEQVVAILSELNRVASRRIFVIDLHRHPLAYYLYTTVGHLFLHNRLIREDGALSILRGFRPGELNQLASQAHLANVSVERRFPFRLVLSGKKETRRRGDTATRGKEKSPAEFVIGDHQHNVF
ncbi:MAG TPA: methyltransferase domain-containing protein [Pyrinomonadaceae bacterium]|jgi:SAM-dependent methyltransferase|nr:methyltransferase domain-containing protein [Pyrinomonadaceae bacterium]